MIVPAHRLWAARALLAAQMVVLFLIARNWAYVTTYRLYLDHRVGGARSAAVQQFDIERQRVVPVIATHGPDRVAFATQVNQDSTIYVGLRPERRTAYAIEWHRGSSRRMLAQGVADGPTSIACPYPTGTGVIDLVSDDALTWVDPRVVRNFRFWPHLGVLACLALASTAWRRSERASATTVAEWLPRSAMFKSAAATLSIVLAVLASEAALRALGDRAPSAILTERHDLGEITRDPRWVDTARYGRRLRANVDLVNEWRHGDIVRMGFIPERGRAEPFHRFSFHTDAEGFRNRGVRDRFEIAALGDSFTDAMTMAAEASWPAQLERRLGVPVQNYGTAGFGPQQELLVLKDFAAAHRPRLVVLAFFAGNDIFDAEAFDDFQRSGGSEPRAAQGWRIKDVVSRADGWFLVSALRAAGGWLGRPHGPVLAAETIDRPVGTMMIGAGGPSFDRGMFELRVAGHRLPFAFMPPYLNTLNFSEQELQARRGWRQTSEAISGMQTVAQSIGAKCVVVFVPFKSQVYLPLVWRAFAKDELRAAFRFYLARYGRDVDLDRLAANRLAQNHLVQRFCERAGIPFVDATPVLERRVQSGENMYFPDDSHLNESGESVLAETLAAWLERLRVS